MFSFFKRLTGKLSQQDSPVAQPTDDLTAHRTDSPSIEPSSEPAPVEQRDHTPAQLPAQDQDNTGLQPTAPVPGPALHASLDASVDTARDAPLDAPVDTARGASPDAPVDASFDPVVTPLHDPALVVSSTTPALLSEDIDPIVPPVVVHETAHAAAPPPPAPVTPVTPAISAVPTLSDAAPPPVVGHIAVPASVPAPPADQIVHLENTPAAHHTWVPSTENDVARSEASSGFSADNSADKPADTPAITQVSAPSKPSLLGRLWGGLAGERDGGLQNANINTRSDDTAVGKSTVPASVPTPTPASMPTPTASSMPAPDSRNSAANPAFGSRSDPTGAQSGFEIVPPPPMAPAARLSWMAKLRGGLSKTSYGLTGLFINVKVDDELFEELETALLVSDAGVEATEFLLAALKQKVRAERLTDGAQVKAALRTLLTELLQPLERSMVLGRAQPLVVMMTGVNGAGKTTSIGKLAKHLQNYGQSVLLAAGDTFRAAAREQLVIWGQRNNVTVVEQSGGDPAAVIFDAVNAARARNIDVMMADTAGRLPTQLHLMEELKKVKRVVGKAMDGAPHEILLVIDANTGQNALAQVKAFDDAIGLTGLIVTKLDGTAKGGILAAIARQRPIPVYFIGVGESVDDLQPFSAAEFTDALLG